MSRPPQCGMHSSTIRFWRMHAVEMGKGGDCGLAPSSRLLNEGRYLIARLALSGLPPPLMPWKHWSAERLGIALAILAALGFSF